MEDDLQLKLERIRQQAVTIYFDPDGNPLTLMEWAQMFERRKEGIADWWCIGKTEVGDNEVSTVWLGLNHNFYPDGPPLIFETMVFGPGRYDDYQRRYTTREQAKIGHEETVAMVRKDKGE